MGEFANVRRLFQKNDNDLIERAKAALERDPVTGALDYNKLVAKVDELMEFNAAKERRIKAERIVRDAERGGKTEPNGQLCLPGFTPFAYEPDRLLRREGEVTEFRRATPAFTTPKLEREKSNMDKAVRSYERNHALFEAFGKWFAAEQKAALRPAAEINFDTFVRTTGCWQPDPAPAADEGEDGDE